MLAAVESVLSFLLELAVDPAETLATRCVAASLYRELLAFTYSTENWS
jgi:hypothetical protein